MTTKKTIIKSNKFTICILLLILILQNKTTLNAQSADSLNISLLTPSINFNPKRVYGASVLLGLTYTSFAVGLNKAWYANYPRSKFHFFNDLGEWRQMDKYGHAFNTYFQCELGYHGAKWAGINDNSSMLIGLGMGMLFQTTIEVLDGFSTGWGFSNWDMGFNMIGAATFLAQQYYWKEQKIRIKFSTFPFKHPQYIINPGDHQISLSQRAASLYGTYLPSRILKDYNATNIWASMNIESLVGPKIGIPPWLNVALGIGANNLYGGFNNIWEDRGIQYSVPTDLYPRYNQYFLALDVDWTKIKTDHGFLKTLFKMINIFKIPSPTVELTSRGDWKWHWFYL